MPTLEFDPQIVSKAIEETKKLRATLAATETEWRKSMDRAIDYLESIKQHLDEKATWEQVKSEMKEHSLPYAPMVVAVAEHMLTARQALAELIEFIGHYSFWLFLDVEEIDPSLRVLDRDSERAVVEAALGFSAARRYNFNRDDFTLQRVWGDEAYRF